MDHHDDVMQFSTLDLPKPVSSVGVSNLQTRVFFASTHNIQINLFPAWGKMLLAFRYTAHMANKFAQLTHTGQFEMVNTEWPTCKEHWESQRTVKGETIIICAEVHECVNQDATTA